MKDEESGVEAAAGAAAPSLVKPRFLVKLECKATLSVEVEIEADSEQHAMDQGAESASASLRYRCERGDKAEEQAWELCDWEIDEEFIRSYNARAVSATALPATGAAATGAATNPDSSAGGAHE